MSQYLPYEGFKWFEDPETFDVRLVTKDSNIGHILEEDIEYPEELHNLHNDYLYCAEQVIVKEDMISDYCSAPGGRPAMKTTSSGSSSSPAGAWMCRKTLALHPSCNR